MKGLVLAGGTATRLFPLTIVTNKHLLPIYDRPMIYYPLDTLAGMGIREVMVIVGGKSVGDIVELLGDGRHFGLDLTYRYQRGALGIAHAIGLARDFIGDDAFCVVLGDNILRGEPLAETVQAFEHGPYGAGTLLYRVPDPERFGVAELDAEGRVVGFEEKPEQPKSDLIPIGVYFLRPDAFDVIETLAPSGRGEFEITDVLNHYIPGGGPVRPGVRGRVGGRRHRAQPPARGRDGGAGRPVGPPPAPRRASGRPGVTDPVGPGAHLLVTGGAGFIGSELVRQVMARRDGTRITVLDKLTYAGNRANLAAVEDDPEQAARFAFVHGDIADPAVVDPLVAEADAVLNVAAETHVDRSILDPEAFLRTGVIGVHVLLEAIRAEAAKDRSVRFLQVSTDEVYGDIPDGHSVETDPLAPRSPYAAAKASSELLVRAYHITYGLDVVMTRGSNTYGPYQHPEKLIPLFTTNALAGEPLPMYGDGMQVRDWLHVSDHAAGIDFVLRHGASGEAYNVAGREAPAQPRGDRPAARGSGPRLEPRADRARPPRPRPPLRDGRLQARRPRLGAPCRLRGRAPRDRRLVPRPPRVGRERAERRLARLLRAPVRGAAGGRPCRRAAGRGGLTAVRVAVVGVNGRLGRALAEALENAPFTGTRGPIGWDQPELDLDTLDEASAGAFLDARAARGRHPHGRLDGRGRLCARPGARDAPQRHRRGRARPRLRPARHRPGVHLDQRGLRRTPDRRHRLRPRRRAEPDQPVRRREGRGRAPGDRGVRGRRRARPPRHRADLVAPRPARRRLPGQDRGRGPPCAGRRDAPAGGRGRDRRADVHARPRRGHRRAARRERDRRHPTLAGRSTTS